MEFKGRVKEVKELLGSFGWKESEEKDWHNENLEYYYSADVEFYSSSKVFSIHNMHIKKQAITLYSKEPIKTGQEVTITIELQQET